MRRIKWLVLVLALMLSACQFGSDDAKRTTGGAQLGDPEFPVYELVLEAKPANMGNLEMQLGQLGPFHGRFLLEFDGKTSWTYQVDLRSQGQKIEYALSVQGVPSEKNPGNVRLVHSAGENYMSGAGTGDFCVRFPDSFVTEKLFLAPEDFIHLDEFANAPVQGDTDKVAGIDAVQYTASTDDHRGWLEVVVNYWVDPATGATLKYDFVAWGNDPLYQQGDGRIHGTFEVLEIGPQQIDDVAGCAIDFPMPDNASEIIRLPGILQYQTPFKPDRLDTFYTNQLGAQGWERLEPQINEATQDGVLEYQKDGQGVSIDVEPFNTQNLDEGFVVRVYLDE